MKLKDKLTIRPYQLNQSCLTSLRYAMVGIRIGDKRLNHDRSITTEILSIEKLLDEIL